MSRDLISRTVRVGYFALTRAAAPATIGVAPDVPPNASVPVPEPAMAETDAPGAPISGLIEFVGDDGPREDDPAMLPDQRDADGVGDAHVDGDRDGQLGLDRVAEGLLDDHRRDERVAAAVGEGDRVTRGDEPQEHGRSSSLGGPLDLQADRTGAAIDERDRPSRVREVGVVRVGVVDGAGRATTPDVGDVAAEPVTDRRPVDGRGVRVRAVDRRRAVDHEREGDRARHLGLRDRQGRAWRLPGSRRCTACRRRSRQPPR